MSPVLDGSVNLRPRGPSAPSLSSLHSARDRRRPAGGGEVGNLREIPSSGSPPAESFADFADWVSGHLDGAGSRGATPATMRRLGRLSVLAAR
jgi:hypothetical protein